MQERFRSDLPRHRRLLQVLVAGAMLLVSVSVVAAMPDSVFPNIIPLPDGHRPEGIATGRGTSFYAGSLGDGSIYAGDLRTGDGDILIPGQAGRVAVGLNVDLRSNLLFVAGGPTGMAFVYDAGSGENAGEYELAGPNNFVNDVIVTRDAAYFTNSFAPEFYRIPLGPGGELPAEANVETIALSSDFDFVPGGFNANGIEATANGRWLVIVNSTTGMLYRVDPQTGEAFELDLGGDSLPNGDGILLEGKTLYVIQNSLNQIAVVTLNNDLSAGMVVDTITNDAFDVPTTLAGFGNALYAVNARFSTPPTPTTEYDIVRVLQP
ncbi:MAG: superoxide dismutase [Anaerolineae bacterium]